MAAPPDSLPVGLVTVRVGSSRLDRKCLLEFGAGNVLEHVLRRAKHFGFDPIVCTTDNPADDIIRRIAAQEGCRCFSGSERDKLRRWRDACRAYHVTEFHTIDADDPFFDGRLCHESLRVLRAGGYDMIYPAPTTYVASVGYSLTADIVERTCATKTTDDTEMMWHHVERVPGLRAASLDVPDARVRDVRLTLDYEEDYWLLRTVLRILGPWAGRLEIEEVFLRNPDLARVNWFRNETWKKGQDAKGS